MVGGKERATGEQKVGTKSGLEIAKYLATGKCIQHSAAGGYKKGVGVGEIVLWDVRY